MWKVLLPIMGAALYFDFINFGYKREDTYFDLRFRINIKRFEGFGRTIKDKIVKMEEK